MNTLKYNLTDNLFNNSACELPFKTKICKTTRTLIEDCKIYIQIELNRFIHN